jgi:fructose/tagatose bisphosphate aldolase
MTYGSIEDLRARIDPIARLGDGGLLIADERRFRDELIDELAFEAVFNADEQVRDACRWLIWSASQALGCPSASIHELYMARGRGEFPAERFTVPAINVRATAYLTARQAMQAAIERDAGAVIWEIAKSEMSYTDQRPAEYTAVILAAAIATGWRGPIFLQGDHFQFNAKKWPEDPQAEQEGMKALTREAIEGGFFNIDIDSSTLVDLSQPTVPEQQRVNAENTAELTRFIRSLEPAEVTISIGGEIGEVGKTNSTEEELRAYLDSYEGLLGGGGLIGISKVSVQTGTSHGGVPMPDGTIAEVEIDFDTLRRLSSVARDEYGLAGCVQHGASTLPEEAFGHFPATGTAEIHLATGFQNILYDSGGLPDDLRAEMMAWVEANCADERSEGQTTEQFLYKTRKKALGPFKRQLWTLPDSAREKVAGSLRTKFGVLFDALGVAGTRELVDRFVAPTPISRPLPAALGGRARQVARAGAGVFSDDPSGE